MSGHDVRELLHLCEQALARPASERAPFLDQACAGNADLRRSIEGLLAEQSDGFLDAPAWASQSPRVDLDPGEVIPDPSADPAAALVRSRATWFNESVEPAGRTMTPPRGITRMLRALSDSLVFRSRRFPKLDVRYVRPLEHYLRQAIHDHVEQAVPLPGAIDPRAADRYHRACAHLPPSDRELVVAALELGYSYDQLALATNRSTPEAAKSAAKRALLHLAEEMSRV